MTFAFREKKDSEYQVLEPNQIRFGKIYQVLSTLLIPQVSSTLFVQQEIMASVLRQQIFSGQIFTNAKHSLPTNEKQQLKLLFSMLEQQLAGHRAHCSIVKRCTENVG